MKKLTKKEQEYADTGLRFIIDYTVNVGIAKKKIYDDIDKCKSISLLKRNKKKFENQLDVEPDKQSIILKKNFKELKNKIKTELGEDSWKRISTNIRKLNKKLEKMIEKCPYANNRNKI